MSGGSFFSRKFEVFAILKRGGGKRFAPFNRGGVNIFALS